MSSSSLPFFVVLAWLLSGCTYHPVKTKYPDVTATTQGAEIYGLPVAENEGEAIEHIALYSTYFAIESDRLASADLKYDDATAYFGLGGILAGIGKSPEGAMAGAFLSGLSQIPSSRYQLAVQSLNYDAAHKAFYCMNMALAPYKGTDTLPDIDFLNKSIGAVLTSLREKQKQVTLVKIDADKLVASLKVKEEKEGAARSGAESLEEKRQKMFETQASFEDKEQEVRELEGGISNAREEGKSAEVQSLTEKITTARNELGRLSNHAYLAEKDFQRAVESIKNTSRERLESVIKGCESQVTG